MNVITSDFSAPKWVRKPQARPEEVLDAALDQFAQNGFAATRMEDIAKAAGLSKAAIYLYFSSKEDVFKALVEARIVVLRDKVFDVAEGMLDDPIAGLRQAMFLWGQANGDPRIAAIPRIILAEATRFPELAAYYHHVVIAGTQRVLISLIEAGISKGQFRAIDPVMAARSLISPMVFETLRRQAFPFETGVRPLGDLTTEFFDLFLNGMLVDPSNAGREIP
jgi:AcrR family transcriptional regulator